MKKNLRAQFAVLRDDPRFGARSDAFFAAQEATLMEAIGADPLAAPVVYTWRDYFEYYQAITGPKFVRTMGTAMAGIALVCSGWLTTVHAASRSLPGDPLYGLKIISEQAQLRLSSLEQRAVLHTEFAERRLQEAVSLQENSTDVAQGDVIQAYAAFRQEIASASNDLQELQVNGSNAAVQTAGIVEKRLGALDDMLDQTAAVSGSAEVSTEAQQAKDASREVQSTAVGVIVDDNEAEESKPSLRELNDMFLREYGNVQARQAFNLHRVAMLANTIEAQATKLEGVPLLSDADLAVAKAAVVDVGTRTGDAMDAFAAGGYRSAFAILHSLDGELLLVESRLAQAEIAVVAALSAPAPVPVEPAPETPTTSSTEILSSEPAS